MSHFFFSENWNELHIFRKWSPLDLVQIMLEIFLQALHWKNNLDRNEHLQNLSNLEILLDH